MTTKARCLLAVLTASLMGLTAARGDDWPQWMGPQRDDVWRETGILEKFPDRGPTILWRTPIAGGYAGPAVADGRVYVPDFVKKGDAPKAKGKAGATPGTERVLCLDEKTGKELWKHEYPVVYKIDYPAGPRCTPAVSGGKVYSLGAMGNLVCLDAKDGKPVWSKDFVKDYGAKPPMWGFCSHPLIDGKKVICIVGGENALAVAFDKDSGKEIWKAGNARMTGYSAPVLIDAGGTKQLLVFSGNALLSLNPETGERYWTVPVEPQFGMAIMTPRKLGDNLFVAAIGNQAVMLKLDPGKPAATEVWRGKKDNALYPVNATPFLEGEMIYGVDQPGQLRGVKLKTGERVWETFVPVTGKEQDPDYKGAATGTAFITKNGDRYFLFNEKGELIIAKLSPEGYKEIGRAKILEPTGTAFGRRDVVWSHPAYADKCMFARNDKEIVCVSLAK